jgi:transcription elongation GreA/GreB family factor
MQNRLAELKAALPDLIAEAARTAAEGDRSDNDAYKQSKSLLRRAHRQIWSIEDQLKRIAVIQPGRNAAGTIQLGSTVVLETEKDAKRIFEIVGPRETNPSRGRISHLSPLGGALLNHKEGDTVTIKTEGGDRTYKVVEVR